MVNVISLDAFFYLYAQKMATSRDTVGGFLSQLVLHVGVVYKGIFESHLEPSIFPFRCLLLFGV